MELKYLKEKGNLKLFKRIFKNIFLKPNPGNSDLIIKEKSKSCLEAI